MPNSKIQAFPQSADTEAIRERQNIMQISNANTAFISKLTTANAAGGAGNDVAALKTKLKALLKLSTDLMNDTTMQADEKKIILQSLQMQIQLIMQQIAELESKGAKGQAAAETPAPPGDQSKQTDVKASIVSPAQIVIDTFA